MRRKVYSYNLAIFNLGLLLAIIIMLREFPQGRKYQNFGNLLIAKTDYRYHHQTINCSKVFVAMFLLDFGYYVTLFALPFAIYSLFFKNKQKRSVYSNKDWFYLFKYYHARSAIREYQEKFAKSLRENQRENLENVKEIQSENHSDSQHVYGVDQKGNSLSLRIAIRSGPVAEVFICLRIAPGLIYTFPGGKNLKLYSISSWHWKTNDLHLEVLEPLKRLRVTFNGLLSKNGADVEHVRFNFIWIAGSTPQFYPQDASVSALTNALASEKWTDGNWMSQLGDERGYEQFGALKGFVQGDSIQEKTVLNLPSIRTRFWGTTEKRAVKRSAHLFIGAKDGSLFSIWAKAFRRGCSQLRYGNVILNNGQVYAIDSSDLRLQFLAQHKNLPPIFAVHVKANKKQYKIVLHLETNESVAVVNEESRGYHVINTQADCDLNTQQAKAIVEFWYSNRGAGMDPPPPLLIENKTEIIPEIYVGNLTSDEAKIVKLSGGKGTSLALLTSLQSDDFKVPEGFVVTTNAFNKQLDISFNIKKAVAILDDICCGRTKGNLEDACAETVKLLKHQKIIKEISDKILQELEKVQKNSDIKTNKWAVRSSGVAEDSEELSAAGQNETFLGCATSDDVMKAITACWASLFTYQSVRYRHQHGVAVQSQMAVVVQKMIPADCAGVLFTCHPTTSNPAQLVITANHGLGEVPRDSERTINCFKSVVSGRSEPDTVVLTRDGLKIISKTIGSKKKIIKMMEDGGVEELDNARNSCSISDEQAVVLGRVGVVLEGVFGGARDIEWGFVGNQLFLLQARPVTTLGYWSDFELAHEFDVATLGENFIYTVANSGEVFPGAQSTLCLTTVLVAVDRAMQKMYVGKVDRYVLKSIVAFDHHVFIEVINSLHKNPTKSINISSKILDLAVFGHVVINEKINEVAIARFGVKTPAQLLGESLKMFKAAWKNDKTVAKIKRDVENFNVGISDRDNLFEIYQKIDVAIEALPNIINLHGQVSSTSVFYQILVMNVLAERHNDFTPEHYHDVALLLSSCDDVISAEIPTILEKIAQILVENQKFDEFSKMDPTKATKWLPLQCPQAAQLFDTFLQDHGHRVFGEFDISKDSWRMNPAYVIKMIQANSKNSTKTQKKTISIDDVISRLTSPSSEITRKLLKWLMVRSRRAVGAREQSKSETIKAVDKIRAAYNLLSHKMVLAGLLPDYKLIFHLSHYEIKLIIKGDQRSPALITKATKRRKLHDNWGKIRFEELSYGEPEAQSDDVIAVGSGDVRCEGTSVCSGTVKARACVITDLKEIDQLQSGDILVTYCTDIGWSPYFPILAGVVTELGGLVSHGAVVAREYGLPCIVGAKGVTKTFKTGDIVVLSGKTGTIERVVD